VIHRVPGTDLAEPLNNFDELFNWKILCLDTGLNFREKNRAKTSFLFATKNIHLVKKITP
jgi:hypothetical protein